MGRMSETQQEKIGLLIIEDNPANMKLASLLLQHAGQQVPPAGDAESGLAIAHAERPDLIFMDIQLPGLLAVIAPLLHTRDSTAP